MVVSANVEGQEQATTGKRGAKQPISADPQFYLDDKQYTISAVNVPGPLMRGAVLYVVENVPGMVKDGNLITGAMSRAGRYAYQQAFAPDFDLAAYEAKIIEDRNAARKTGGNTRSATTSKKAAVLDNLLDDDDLFSKIAEMKKQGLSKEEIRAALALA